MKKRWMAILLGVVLVLAACSGEKEQEKEKKTSEEGVGFNLTGESIEEAVGVPKEEKEQILHAFNAYITAFNEKDMEAYIGTLSKESESFDFEEERALLAPIFEENDVQRVMENVTIVKYADTEAQVFGELSVKVKQLATGLETNSKGRQVTVLKKIDGEWKIDAIHYVGDDNPGK